MPKIKIFKPLKFWRCGLFLFSALAILLTLTFSNAFAVTIDGNFSDWSDIPPVLTDPSDASGQSVDWLEIRTTSDSSNFYIYYETSSNIDLNTNGWRYNIFLDTDSSTATGFNNSANSNLLIGADYLLQGANLFSKAGGPSDHGWNWAWAGGQSYSVSGNKAEFSIPKSAIGSPIKFDIQGFGDNASVADWTSKGTYNGPKPIVTTNFEEASLSWYASGNPGVVGYNVYRRIHRFDSEPAVNITMDGSFSDWNNITKASSFPYPPEDNVHMEDIWVANDADNLYVRIKYSSDVKDALEPSIWLDVDRNLSTGSASKNWRGLKIGAELWYDIRGFDGNGNPLIRRRQWGNAWAGPYPYNEFLPGNYADPVWAWISNYDLSADRWAVGDDGFYDDAGTLISQHKNGWEIKIPFSELEALTGVNIDERKFGIDMFFTAYWDHFPTVGYAPKSPVKFEYGYKKINTSLVTTTNIIDHPIGTLTYDYYVFEVYSDGSEEPLGSPASATVKRAHPANLNASIINQNSLKVEFDYPEEPTVSSVKVIRRTDRFAASPADGVVIADVTGTPNQHIQITDSNLTTAQAYFYTGFGMTASGKSSQEFWDTKDRSIPAIVRGPITGLNTNGNYMIYFASWDDKRVDFAKKYDLVILHPGGGAPLITKEQVAEIKAGLDGIPGNADDVMVVGYVSIGEDFGINPKIIKDNTTIGKHPNLSDYPAGPWDIREYNYPRKISTSTTGPVRYEFETDEKIYENSSDEKSQFPSFYTDMIDYYGQGGAGSDHIPDQNIEWGGLFVDAEDPAWQTFIREATADKDYVSGIDWVLGNQGNQLNCDGIFLDTVGVSSTWSAWFPASLYGDLYWAKDGHLDFMAKIGAWYPTKIIMPNRPMQFVFPGFAGKRYDDFRAVTSSLFWESYTPDMDFWWPGNHAKTLENDVIAAQNNSDGRGFTTLALDYWAVMIDAEEGGEFQGAPWYDTISEQVARAESKGFISHVQGSRSMADLTDYVYLYHNAANLPDLYVHSISGHDNGNGTITAAIKISNQGTNIATPFNVSVQLNDTSYSPETINSLARYEIYTFQRTLTKQTIGNNLLVSVDTGNVINEFDEQAGYIESNNSKSKYLDRFFSPAEGWYPTGFAPDVTITKVEVIPEYPVVGQSMTMHISYTNASSEGVATDSRMYVWMGTAEGGSQIGNEYTPYLMPSETKVLNYSYTPLKAGFYSIGVVSDGPKKIIESNEKNNEGPGAALVLKSADRNPVTNRTGVDVLGPMPDDAGDGVSSAADIRNIWITSDIEYVYYRMQCEAGIDVITYRYIIFIDTDLSASTGYSVGGGGADFVIINGDLYSYTGSGTDWSWKGVSYENSPVFVVENDERYLDVKIKRSTLGLVSGQKFSSYFTVGDENNSTTDDSTTVYTYPPIKGLLTIDGKFTDWDAEPTVASLGIDPSDDGYDQSGNAVPGQLGAFADIKNVYAAKDSDYLFMRLGFLGNIDFTKAEYTIYLDMDRNSATGYKTSWDTVGAEYRFYDGTLYKYTGDGTIWAWEQVTGAYYAVGTTDATQMEVAINRSQINWTANGQIKIFITSSDKKDTGWADDIIDFIPEQGNSAAYPRILPDLEITSITCSPSDPIVSLSTKITVVVNNSGYADSGSFQVSLNIAGVPKDFKTISGLALGASSEVTFDWTPDSAGSFLIKTVADSASQVEERDEANNEKEIYITVQDLISGLLTIDGKFTDWDAEPTVASLGTDVLIVMGDPGPPVQDIGAFADIQKAWAAKDANYLFMRLAFLGDIDLTKAEYTIYLDIDRNSATGYKTSWGIVGAEHRFYNGVLYRYIGDGYSWDWTQVTGAYYAIGTSDPTQMELAIKRNQIGWVTDSSIKVFIVSSDKKGDGWEDDIADFMPEPGKFIGYPAIPKPNLTVASVTVLPASPWKDMPATATAVVKNLHLANSADAFDVGLFVDGKSVGTKRVNSLGPNQSTTLTFNWTPLSAGTLWAGINADTVNEIVETNEADNSLGKSVIFRTGTIKIKKDAQYTNSTNVSLSLSATAAGVALSQMKFSNDDKTYSTPQAYAVTKASWILITGDGTKTVYAKFKDAAGNWSSAISDTIILDTTLPTGTIKIKNDAQYTGSTAVSLNLSAADTGSGMGTGAQMKFSNDNVTYSTAQAYAVLKSSWTLTAANGTKTVYAKFKDAAGNWTTVAIKDTIILDTTVPTTPVVTDEGVTTINRTQLKANWTSSDTLSGIAEYQYSIGTAKGSIDVVPWTSIGTTPSVTKIGLSLIASKTYYFNVKAKNGAGLWSAVGYSDGILVK